VKRESQIRQKIKQVVFRHKKRFVQEGMKRRPANCKHNAVVRLPQHTGNRATIGVCRYYLEEVGWHNRVCDSSMAGDQQAEECPYFDCLHTPKMLKESFDKRLGLEGDRVEVAQIAEEFPDIAALLWVLGPSDEKNTPLVPEERSSNNSVIAVFGEDIEEESLDEL
jgi:hypothetical protein